jgi:hypothetical protein
LKEVVERIAGKKSTDRKQGSRGPREHKRERDESTIQVPVGDMPASAPPPAPGAAQTAPPAQPPSRQAPPPPAYTPPQQPAPAPQPAAPPAAPAPPPMAAAPTPAAPQPAPGGVVISADATLYAEIPQIETGELVGLLVGVSGELKGKIYKVFEGETRVGRGQDCDIQLLDAQVSREHALIVCEDGALAILPLQDKNPIVVGEEDVDEGAELSDGNLVRFGNPGATAFRFRTIEGL